LRQVTSSLNLVVQMTMPQHACVPGGRSRGDGLYSFTARALKAGTCTLALFLNEDSSQTLGDPQKFTVQADGDEIFIGYDEVKEQTIVSTTGQPKGSLAKQDAIWVNQDTVMWNVVGSPKYSYSLFYSPDASIGLTSDGIRNGFKIPLTFNVLGRTTAVFVIEGENPALVPTLAKAIPAETPVSNSNTLIMAGVVTILLALLGVGIAMRRKMA